MRTAKDGKIFPKNSDFIPSRGKMAHTLRPCHESISKKIIRIFHAFIKIENNFRFYASLSSSFTFLACALFWSQMPLTKEMIIRIMKAIEIGLIKNIKGEPLERTMD